MRDVHGGELQRLKWLSETVRRQLLDWSANDPGFKKRSAVNKVNRASSKGGYLHTGGSATIPKTRARMMRSLDRTPTDPELFKKMDTRKRDRSIVEKRAGDLLMLFFLRPSSLPTSNKPPKPPNRRGKRVMRVLARLTRTMCGVRLCLSHTRTGFTGLVDSSPHLSTDPAMEVHPPLLATLTQVRLLRGCGLERAGPEPNAEPQELGAGAAATADR
ncbi:hypothetical protein PIB30_084982 [Stylosanthes scabra]|uniref:Uncharacterized protein n=1 Tax=Stylosanthes scabra TaxID=79078 RepID=A0ABU6WTP7_9FABA|nr:hypothetical protein [Stylosanthes scabra]